MSDTIVNHSGKLNTIGDIAIDKVLETARNLHDCGGAEPPLIAHTMDDFEMSDSDSIRITSKAHAQNNGTILLCSGGTTGAPKLTFVPYEQSINRIANAWHPLQPENVMLNLYNPGRLWGSHYYMMALAQKIGCGVVPMGSLMPDEVESYMHILQTARVDTLAGTPTAIHDFVTGLKKCNGQLNIKKIMWVGEPWNKKKKQEVEDIIPKVEFWGNYGSIETYVIASNTPKCPHNTFHLHPDQLLELDEDGALLTRVGVGWTVPTLRYRLGDTLEKVTCQCGRPHAFQVRGRADSSFLFGSKLFDSSHILAFLQEQAGVDEAQLQLRGVKSQSVANTVDIQYVGNALPNDVLEKLIDNFTGINMPGLNGSARLSIKSVPQIARNERTHKITRVTWLN